MEENKFKEIEEKEEKPKSKRGNHRKRIAQKGLSIQKTKELNTKKEKIKTNNTMKDKANKQFEIIAQKFIDDPTPFFDKKEKEIAKFIEKYGDLENQDLENGKLSKKDYCIELAYYTSKPFLRVSKLPSKYSATTLQMVSDFYWEKVVIPINRKMQYIPIIDDLLRLLSISRSTFENYCNNGDEEMRETCQIILGQFIAYYERRGLTKEISEIMSMFILKTTYKQRENDVPQVVIQNNNISADDTIRQLAKQYGFEKYEEK